jgi:hypothetical protein
MALYIRCRCTDPLLPPSGLTELRTSSEGRHRCAIGVHPAPPGLHSKASGGRTRRPLGTTRGAVLNLSTTGDEPGPQGHPFSGCIKRGRRCHCLSPCRVQTAAQIVGEGGARGIALHQPPRCLDQGPAHKGVPRQCNRESGGDASPLPSTLHSTPSIPLHPLCTYDGTIPRSWCRRRRVHSGCGIGCSPSAVPLAGLNGQARLMKPAP